MATQEKYSVCKQCGKGLQLEVKYCPFCGISQIAVQPIVELVEVEAYAETASANSAEDHQDNNEAVLEDNPALVSHITQKTNKELRGVIITGSSLEELKQYDRYAFKKQQGIFLRLQYLASVPDNLLNVDQLELKYQYDIACININAEAALAEQPLIIPAAEKEAVAVSQPTVEAAPLDIPPPKSSSFKYIAIAFIVILIVIFFVFSDKKQEMADMPADTGAEAGNCENANNEISSLLSEKMPARALSIIKLHQNECKTNNDFVKLLVSAEAQVTSAKEKIGIAKEYVQAGDLGLAHETVMAALDLDAEVTGGPELLQSIQLLIEQQNNVQVEAIALAEETTEAPVMMEQPSSPQVDQTAALVAENARRQAQAEWESQQAEVLARQQAEQANRERQQAAEAARKKNEDRFLGQLSRAEKALNSGNYGLAKSLAREVLSNSSTNAQAKRILRQAEEGEAKAFDDMVIE